MARWGQDELLEAKRRKIRALNHEIERLQERGRAETAPRILKIRNMIKGLEYGLRQTRLF